MPTLLSSPSKWQFVTRAALVAVLVAGFLSGPGRPDQAIAAPNPEASFTDCAGQTDIPETECLALLALYNSADGDNWIDNTDWWVTADLCDWFGVICDGVPGNVSDINMSGNNLNGSLPAEIGDLTSMGYMDVGGNLLSGSIPAEIGALTNLQILYLNDNQLTGSIPPELENLSILMDLSFHTNQLTGSIPPELGSLSLLQYLNLHDNQLSGTIPPALGSLSNLVSLYLDTNRLSGPLPQEFTNLSFLTKLFYYNTTLCAPGNVDFQNWLTGVPTRNTTNLHCDVIFSDGFESGDTTAWSSTVEGPAQLSGLFSGQYLPPGLGLIVHPKAAAQGGYGLGAIVEDNHPMFVQDDTPAAETQYRARFNLFVKSLTAGNNKGMGILLGSGTGKSFQVFTGWDGAQHVVVARVGWDDGHWTWTSFYAIPTNDWIFVEIDWAAATGDGNNDGYFSLYLDGVLQETIPTLDNDTVSVDTVRLGPFYVSPGATGIVGFDAFSSENVYPKP